jgi:diphosphomevalonate decarboxylase
LWEGDSDETSYARQVAPPEYWDLQDLVAIVSHRHKVTSSYDGHGLAPGSPFHAARLAAVADLLATVEVGLGRRDLSGMGPAIEADALAMHGVMMTSNPALLYWEPGTMAVLQEVRAWRQEGLEVFFTMDAGPNVHCLSEGADADLVETKLGAIPGVEAVLRSGPGNGVRIVDHYLF